MQRLGGHLASIVMPNIGAFIAWGLITALFIPDGWLPNPTLAQLVDPMVRVLLPILIAYTGGRLVHEHRGGVVGAVATIGIVVGTDIPMFFGAMIMGPVGALAIKLFDRYIGHRASSGFKMLVDNFSAGIIGGALAVVSMLSIGPAVEVATKALGSGVHWVVDQHLLPLVSLIIEPAKVLFLNNAVNHGVLAPLGVEDAAATGKAIHFLLETNPGPGLGILLACSLFGDRMTRATAPGAIIIHFLGGIHEIYFPYVLAAPRLILAAIAGGATGVFVFNATGAGLIATPSPGSIIALMAVTPRGGYLPVIAGVAAAAIVSFVVAAALLKFGRGKDDDVESGGRVTAHAAPQAVSR
ncbi:PTS system D-mannitol-specific IIB component (Fru family) /PTS system D-mannitol-specific IIC component (Fru family) [Umezawaea tangerina]|uniref:PTS system D-mannitol-specific IIB component (Fru family) /PTS system D-mannitol-specific IIC component (Fru family) n=1 Tax=Umezawaea tangerina TaxID=84725 RepID=A0A2T0THB2_9PSEU|nr:PTS system D-mannitol-specific IIB component (Fru family) /PTS system D-mannitol-specific IIC component (Fru family) [Umezawaea tangerina]